MGVKYFFDRSGDGLPEHIHIPSEEHNIIVLSGRVALIMNGVTVYGDAGNILDFDGAKPHRIVALKEKTQILNLFLNGPNLYSSLPMSDLTGSLECFTNN
jgi:quercetin dioxygenase-like cupin family protein